MRRLGKSWVVLCRKCEWCQSKRWKQQRWSRKPTHCLCFSSPCRGSPNSRSSSSSSSGVAEVSPAWHDLTMRGRDDRKRPADSHWLAPSLLASLSLARPAQVVVQARCSVSTGRLIGGLDDGNYFVNMSLPRLLLSLGGTLLASWSLSHLSFPSPILFLSFWFDFFFSPKEYTAIKLKHSFTSFLFFPFFFFDILFYFWNLYLTLWMRHMKTVYVTQ